MSCLAPARTLSGGDDDAADALAAAHEPAGHHPPAGAATAPAAVAPRRRHRPALWSALGVPPHEELLYDAACALRKAILVQGRLFIFTHSVGFYSSLLGIVTKKLLPLRDVTAVHRVDLHREAVFGALAVEMRCGKTYVFASCWHPDSVVAALAAAWRAELARLSQAAPAPAPGGGGGAAPPGGTAAAAAAAGPPCAAAPAQPARGDEAPTASTAGTRAPAAAPAAAPGRAAAPPFGVGGDDDDDSCRGVGGVVGDASRHSRHSSHGSLLSDDPPAPPVAGRPAGPPPAAAGWTASCAAAPVPLPCAALFDALFGDGSRFTDAFHGARRDFDLVVRQWAPVTAAAVAALSPPGGPAAARTVTFCTPLGAALRVLPGVPPCARITEQQTARFFSGLPVAAAAPSPLPPQSPAAAVAGFELLSSSTQRDTPYSSCFAIETRLWAEEVGGGCVLRAAGRVRWLQPPNYCIRSIIEAAAKGATAAALQQMLQAASAYAAAEAGREATAGHAAAALASRPHSAPAPPPGCGGGGRAGGFVCDAFARAASAADSAAAAPGGGGGGGGAPAGGVAAATTTCGGGVSRSLLRSPSLALARGASFAADALMQQLSLRRDSPDPGWGGLDGMPREGKFGGSLDGGRGGAPCAAAAAAAGPCPQPPPPPPPPEPPGWVGAPPPAAAAAEAALFRRRAMPTATPVAAALLVALLCAAVAAVLAAWRAAGRAGAPA